MNSLEWLLQRKNRSSSYDRPISSYTSSLLYEEKNITKKKNNVHIKEHRDLYDEYNEQDEEARKQAYFDRLDCDEYGDVLISGKPRSGPISKEQAQQVRRFEDRCSRIRSEKDN